MLDDNDFINEIDLISSKELVRRSGSTYRQIDYWCKVGIIEAMGADNPGSGRTRKWDKALVPKLRVMGKISRAFGGTVSTEVLKRIYEDYEIGFIDTGTGIRLSWKVEE